MAEFLDKINGLEDLQSLSVEQLTQLAEEIRALITESVSQTGGHLASNLGVVELTIATFLGAFPPKHGTDGE